MWLCANIQKHFACYSDISQDNTVSFICLYKERNATWSELLYSHNCTTLLYFQEGQGNNG